MKGIADILNDYKNGKIELEKAVELLSAPYYEELSFACLDHHRFLRKGIPEVIFGQGKSADQIVEIAKRIIERSGKLIITRVSRSKARFIKRELPEVTYNDMAKVITWEREKRQKRIGKIVVVCAGTSDLPVAEEAYVTADFFGNRVEKILDVGVSGLHRLFDKIQNLFDAKVVIAVAGMEGALASVISGLLPKPVIAVPTSVGYGASFGGLSALLAMLNACASGVCVVNIDNGFGAAYVATLINRIGEEE